MVNLLSLLVIPMVHTIKLKKVFIFEGLEWLGSSHMLSFVCTLLGSHTICYVQQVLATLVRIETCLDLFALSEMSFCEPWLVRMNDVVEAHCYIVDIGRTDREQIHSRINNN